MQLPKGSGLEFLDKLARRSIKYYSGILKSEHIAQNLFPAIKTPAIELPTLNDLKRPVESIIKGLNDAVAHITAKPERNVDYNVIVNSFLPPGARLIKPQYPDNAGEIQFSDLDGDGRSELITSYRTNEGIMTLVLKKDDVQWYKMAEINSPEYTDIHYRTNADITGEGRKDLLLGLVSDQQERTLFAYSLSDGSSKKIFGKNYSKLELVKTRSSSGSGKDAAAIWHEDSSSGIYDIELVHWNGMDLEQLDNKRYLAGRVLPYYIKRLRQDPSDTKSWYNLAEAFMKTGDSINAARAVSRGLDVNQDPLMKERFTTLQNML